MKFLILTFFFVSSVASAKIYKCPTPNQLKYSTDIQYNFDKNDFEEFRMNVPKKALGWKVPKSNGARAIYYPSIEGQSEINLVCIYTMIAGDIQMEQTINPSKEGYSVCSLLDSGRTDSKPGSKNNPRTVKFSSQSQSKGSFLFCDKPLRGECLLECK